EQAGWLGSAFGQEAFHLSADARSRLRRKKAPDHVGIFVHDAETARPGKLRLNPPSQRPSRLRKACYLKLAPVKHRHHTSPTPLVSPILNRGASGIAFSRRPRWS